MGFSIPSDHRSFLFWPHSCPLVVPLGEHGLCSSSVKLFYLTQNPQAYDLWCISPVATVGTITKGPHLVSLPDYFTQLDCGNSDFFCHRCGDYPPCLQGYFATYPFNRLDSGTKREYLAETSGFPLGYFDATLFFRGVFSSFLSLHSKTIYIPL